MVFFSLPPPTNTSREDAESKTKQAHALQIDNAMASKREIVNRLRRELRYYRAILRDPRTPRAARWLIGVGVGYLLMPIDIVPDFIPIVGQLDDAIVVSIFVGIGMFFVPASVRQDVRLRTRPIRTLNAQSEPDILCETEALPSPFGVRVTALDTGSTVEHEEIIRALLGLVFEEHVVVIDRSVGREIFESIGGIPRSQSLKTCRLDRIASHGNPTLGMQNVEVENRDADRRFIDMQAAYEALSLRYKKRIDCLKVFPRAPSEMLLHQSALIEGQFPVHTAHPLVPTHPVTNRKLLSPDLEGCRIVGMPDESGLRILEDLRRHAQQSKFRYEHRKTRGEIVVWDSTTTLNRIYVDTIASPLDVARPTVRAAGSLDLHPSYRVALRPERSASPSAGSAPIH
jgi:uncharacterized membrane protein YkvA (DUF1232 family)